MLKGHINIDFLTDEMLHETHFVEKTHIGFNWRELGISEPPEPQESAIVYQSFGDQCPEWAHRIKDMFADKVLYPQVTINLVKPGNFIPPHKDKFIRLKEFAKQKGLSTVDIVPQRINIFLQDHKLGHFFEMQNNVLLNYSKGDFTIIPQNTIHSVVNIGNENRYTLQVTGFVKQGTFA